MTMPKEENTTNYKESEKNNGSNINLTDVSSFKKVNRFFSRFQHISITEKIFFVQQLGIMTKAGISLAKALEILNKQTKNKRFQKIISHAYESVIKGETLAQGLRPYSVVFGEIFINMLEAGEKSGTLEEILKQIHLQMKKSHEFLSKTRGALAYPAVVLAVMLLIGTGVVIFVVPKFITIFEQVQMELPIMTKILIAVSGYINKHGIFVLILVVAAITALIKFSKTTTGKNTFHLVILKMPIMGPISQKINMAKFARAMSSLLKTDIKIADCFKISSGTINNVYYKKSLIEASEKVVKGEEINKILAQYPNLYSPSVVQMVAIGEESGELDTILTEIAEFYEEEVKQIMDTLPTIIEPVIIILLAVLIGGMAIAIIMPMYSLVNAF
ncbi:hypothetical protein COT95_02360 [Candidatus Falkowbacteria bacterium CG10_big_fil_rev_8_21_14_0_10_37_6]|uniref:Type II secretion system protein GspF domain-containing protein n=1 Tax=Candidatus Falkowbacteria bacterium CG10_big_fil_rev_8_21_14_0_10_37_6 TaxID=1974563 RepID=A0A2H0V6T6_9BACT|nr:MAG: hypothetical protein COT95_02360 [Candidatus Falkowbacteria bacterium CG10_big_fil_rev_8_21_14_0_10_37_6]